MKQKLLLIDDEADVHYSFKRVLEKEPIEIITADSPEAGVKLAKSENPDLIVTDIRMGNRNGLDGLRELRLHNPKQIVIVMTAYGTSQTAIEAMKLGAYDYILKPFDIPQLKALITRALQAAAVQKTEVTTFPTKLSAEELRQTIVGSSPAMQEVYKIIGQVASTTATVLITGESGTGKELIARAINQNSPRFKNTYVALNCAAIPENLLESELFGHEKGAFTGAMNQRIGKFEQCDGGTLFLDEIGEMPLATQAKFLRVLQEGEFTRLGNNESMKTDVRIIAATNKDLPTMVEQKSFREDLYYRLNVVHLHLPPLRERTGDIPILVEYFMNKIRLKTPNSPSKISPEAMEILKANPWPGNVRELENGLQRCMVMASGSTILPHHLPKDFIKNSGVIAPVASISSSPSGNPEQLFDQLFEFLQKNPDQNMIEVVQKELALRAMNASENDESKASKILGLSKAAFKKIVG